VSVYQKQSTKQLCTKSTHTEKNAHAKAQGRKGRKALPRFQRDFFAPFAPLREKFFFPQKSPDAFEYFSGKAALSTTN
jgi:hypothetical protein